MCDANNSVRAAEQLQNHPTRTAMAVSSSRLEILHLCPDGWQVCAKISGERRLWRGEKDDEDLLFPTCGRLCKEHPESFKQAREASAVRVTLCYSSSSVK